MNAVLPPTPSAVPPTLTNTPTPRPSETPVPSPTGTPTFTPTATETSAPTATLTASPQQLQIFEELWNIVNEEYLYPDFNGLDWEAIHQEYRQLIESGLSDEDFYLSMDEMIFRLGDDHSVFLSPQEVVEEELNLPERTITSALASSSQRSRNGIAPLSWSHSRVVRQNKPDSNRGIICSPPTESRSWMKGGICAISCVARKALPWS